MTSLQLLAQDLGDIHSPVSQKTRRPLKTRWHYGRGYVVIAAIAPFVLISLLMVHLHSLGQQWTSSLERWVSAKR
ncbi:MULTISPECIES: hypothetical protein [unclassified Leptolyngbya]|uniref:hypothetical protein n=1 Tax=unclassified Leptolyngbya TaxID=2650499 RepID=UPI001689F02A|nr:MULTISPECIES: hypothetical protein [unclassified Leptolyngbya]MBD1909880.1 hypothetical protein [Leptolyngbya sp. FACHB-8]MBD2156976.1 hypothetical protein [Leptolyngbya sp. FACHB-16]